MKWEHWPTTPHYMVSDTGIVREHQDDYYRILPRRDDGRGYLCVDIKVDGRYRPIKIHKLVMEAFHGPTPRGFHIDHINHIKTDNRLENLAFRPAGENSADCKKTSRAGIKVLTDDQKMAIIILHEEIDWTHKRIAMVIGCGESTVRRVLGGPR